MSTEPINYEAVIADLEAKKTQLEATIAMLRALGGLGTVGNQPSPGNDSGPGSGSGSRFAHDAFLGKSIPEAAVAVLSSVRKKMSTQSLMEIMESGGLAHSKYNTVYSILRRRENQVGDIINFQGEWALAAWHPNHTKAKKRVSLNPKTFETTEDEELDEDAIYESAKDIAMMEEVEEHQARKA